MKEVDRVAANTWLTNDFLLNVWFLETRALPDVLVSKVIHVLARYSPSSLPSSL